MTNPVRQNIFGISPAFSREIYVGRAEGDLGIKASFFLINNAAVPPEKEEG